MILPPFITLLTASAESPARIQKHTPSPPFIPLHLSRHIISFLYLSFFLRDFFMFPFKKLFSFYFILKRARCPILKFFFYFWKVLAIFLSLFSSGIKILTINHFLGTKWNCSIWRNLQQKKGFRLFGRARWGEKKNLDDGQS